MDFKPSDLISMDYIFKKGIVRYAILFLSFEFFFTY